MSRTISIKAVTTANAMQNATPTNPITHQASGSARPEFQHMGESHMGVRTNGAAGRLPMIKVGMTTTSTETMSPPHTRTQRIHGGRRQDASHAAKIAAGRMHAAPMIKPTSYRPSQILFQPATHPWPTWWPAPRFLSKGAYSGRLPRAGGCDLVGGGGPAGGSATTWVHACLRNLTTVREQLSDESADHGRRVAVGARIQWPERGDDVGIHVAGLFGIGVVGKVGYGDAGVPHRAIRLEHQVQAEKDDPAIGEVDQLGIAIADGCRVLLLAVVPDRPERFAADDTLHGGFGLSGQPLELEVGIPKGGGKTCGCQHGGRLAMRSDMGIAGEAASGTEEGRATDPTLCGSRRSAEVLLGNILTCGRLCMQDGSANAWMRTLSLPRFFLAIAIFVFALEVGAGVGLRLVPWMHASWTRSDLAFSAISTLLIAVVLTFKERWRRG